MLKKLIGTGYVLGVVAFVGTTAFMGCSSTTPATPGTDLDSGPADTGPKVVDSGRDTGPAPVVDTGVTPTGCYDSTKTLTLKAGLTAKGSQKLCTAAQITGFQTACLPGTAAGCKTYTDDVANKACLSCIEGGALPDGGTTGALPVLLPANSDGTKVYIDLYACGYVTVTKPACAFVEANHQICIGTSCQDCTATADRTTCQKAADADVCKDLVQTTDCTTAFTGGKAAIDTACGAPADFVKVATVLCGP